MRSGRLRYPQPNTCRPSKRRSSH